MLNRKIKETKAKQQAQQEKQKKKTTPAYLQPEYPYQVIGNPIVDLGSLQNGTIYEIKCHKCEMSIRSQGQNIKSTYERLMAGNGCISCGNKELIVKRVDMSGLENK